MAAGMRPRGQAQASLEVKKECLQGWMRSADRRPFSSVKGSGEGDGPWRPGLAVGGSPGGPWHCLLESAQAFTSAQQLLAFPASASSWGASECGHQTASHHILLPQLKPPLPRMARWALRPNPRTEGPRGPTGPGACAVLAVHPVGASQFSAVCSPLSPLAFPPTPVSPSSHHLLFYPSALHPGSRHRSSPRSPSAAYQAHTLGFSSSAHPLL